MASSATSPVTPQHSQGALRIVARQVPSTERQTFLPRVFGNRYFLQGELQVFSWMATLAPDYTGGLWQFYDLSNGGFYLALDPATPALGETPQGQVRLMWEDNFFDDVMSLDAAGIVVTLFAINALIWLGADALHDAYERLRDYISEHPEASKIWRAID